MGAFSVYFDDGRWQEGRRTVGGVWSVGSSLASGSRELLAECGLSGQVWRVGQRNCRRVWSVGTSLLRGSRGLLAECGLSGQVWRVGQRNCRQSLVCRGEKGEWVKRIVGGVWSVGTSLLRGSKELATACGLSAQVCCVGQENCRRVWSVGSSMASESRGLSVGVVCRGENVAWVKGTVARVWSVGVKRASEPKKPHISYASNVANCHSDQNCQNPQNMIHLL